MGKSTISMAIFNSYDKLPEGIPIYLNPNYVHLLSDHILPYASQTWYKCKRFGNHLWRFQMVGGWFIAIPLPHTKSQ